MSSKNLAIKCSKTRPREDVSRPKNSENRELRNRRESGDHLLSYEDSADGDSLSLSPAARPLRKKVMARKIH